jgi:hypothetical protein
MVSALCHGEEADEDQGQSYRDVRAKSNSCDDAPGGEGFVLDLHVHVHGTHVSSWFRFWNERIACLESEGIKRLLFERRARVTGMSLSERHARVTGMSQSSNSCRGRIIVNLL